VLDTSKRQEKHRFQACFRVVRSFSQTMPIDQTTFDFVDEWGLWLRHKIPDDFPRIACEVGALEKILDDAASGTDPPGASCNTSEMDWPAQTVRDISKLF
jgi:hypothetical protein